MRDGSGERSISDLERSGEISIPADGIREPQLRRSGSGTQHHVLPGNKRFVEGDTIERDEDGPGGAGSWTATARISFASCSAGRSSWNSSSRTSNCAKRRLADLESEGMRRAGHRLGFAGEPRDLRTMRVALSRRIAMQAGKRRPEPARRGNPFPEETGNRPISSTDCGRSWQGRQRHRTIPFIDPLDLRYRHHVPASKPMAQAVMFCLMDVSAR